MLRRLVLRALVLTAVVSACRGSEQREDEVRAASGVPAVLSINGQELETRMVEVDSSFFGSLREQPFLGRVMLAEEFGPGAASVVVLSHRLWEELGARPDVIGQHASLAGREMIVVGIMPPGFPEGDESLAWTQRKTP